MPDTWLPARPELVPRTGGAGWYRLAAVTRAALVLNVFVYAVDVVGSWWAARRLGSWLDDPSSISLSDAQRIDTLNQTTAIVELALLVLTGVLFICWIYQAYSRPLAERSALRMERGWAIGGWLIPFANYVIPYRVVQGVSCATATPARARSRLVLAWWAAWVTFNVAGVASRLATPTDTDIHGRALIRSLRVADSWAAVSAVPGVVAAVLAAVVVAHVTARVRDVTSVSPIPA